MPEVGAAAFHGDETHLTRWWTGNPAEGAGK
jgi:hypothetical protein